MSDSFNPDPYLNTIGGRKYLNVAGRIAWFRDAYPHDRGDLHGHIETKIFAANETWACVHARVTITDNESHVVATGEGDAQEFAKNFPDHLEKASTAAVGRALGALGFGTNDLEFDEGTIGGQVAIVDSPRGGAQSPIPMRPGINTYPQSTNSTGSVAISPKQAGLVRGLAREKNVNPEGEASRLFGVSSLDELTGGRGGTASQLIDHLQRLGAGDFTGNVDDSGREPGYSLSHPASNAVNDGMAAGALAFWIGKVRNVVTEEAITAVQRDAEARFGDKIPDSFYDEIARRTDEVRRG